MVKYKAKAVKIGKSLYVVIPHYISDLLNIKEGDQVIVNVEKA